MKKLVLLLVLTIVLNSGYMAFGFDAEEGLPQNISISQMSKGSAGDALSISWCNPAGVRQISLYDVTQRGTKTLIKDDFSTLQGKSVVYHATNVSYDELYKYLLYFSYEDGTSYTCFLQGRPLMGDNSSSVGTNSNWKMVYGRKDGTEFYPQADFRIVKEGENHLLRLHNNTAQKTDGNFAILKYLIATLKSDTNYRLSFDYKASGVTAISVRTDSTIIGTIQEDSSTSKRLEYDFNTGNQTITYVGLELTEALEACYIDNVELYELDATMNPMENSLIQDGGFEFSEYTGAISTISDFSYDDFSYLKFTAPTDAKTIDVYLVQDGRKELKARVNQTSSYNHEVYIDGLLTGQTNDLEVVCVNQSGMASEGTMFTVTPLSLNELNHKRDAVDGYLAELEELLTLCHRKGISTDYEQVDISVIRRFCAYMQEDFTVHGEYERALGYYDVLENLYHTTKENLTGYLDGTKVPKSVPKYVGTDLTLTEEGFLAETVRDGMLNTTPLFLNGYAGFTQTQEDFPELDKFGVNAGNVSVKLYDVITPYLPIPEWNLFENIVGDCSYSVTTDADAHSGDASLKITRETAKGTNKTFYIRQTVDAKPNTTYVFGLWAKADTANSAHFSGHPLIDSDHGLSGRTRHYIGKSDDWKNYEYEYTTADDEYTMELLIPVEGKTTLYLDDVYLREKDGENLLQNPGFEESVLDSGQEYGVYLPYVKEAIRQGKLAKRSGLSVDASLALHHMPQFMYRRYSDLRDEGCTYPSYLPYNPTHPKAKEIIHQFMDAVIPELVNAGIFDGICILNEPSFQIYQTDYYLAPWQGYLQERYSNISALNQACKTDFTSFSQVDFSIAEVYPVLYKHLLDYNDQIMTEFVTDICQKIRSIAQDVRLYAKFLPTVRAYGNVGITYGVDPEALAPYLDLNGCDGVSFHNAEQLPLLAKMEWYDLLASVKNAPVVNAEDHTIQDNPGIDGNEKIIPHAIADIWQGAIHQRTKSLVWLWDRSANALQGVFSNPNVLTRPELASEYGKKFLDLNRLAKEIIAIQKEAPKVAILYSKTTQQYEKSYMHSLYLAYTNALFHGVKPVFITEDNIDALNRVSMLILPGTISVPNTTVDAIAEFSQKGGKVVFMGTDCLAYDETLNQRTDTNLSAVKNGALVIPVEEKTEEQVTVTNESETFRKLFDDAGLCDIVLTHQDGTRAEQVEINIGSDAMYRYVNLCNYTWTDKSVRIEQNGKIVASSLDLISGETQGEYITLKPYSPVLVRFLHENAEGISLQKWYNNSNGEPVVFDTNVIDVTRGCVEATAVSKNRTAILFMALYKNDAMGSELEKVVCTTDIDEDGRMYLSASFENLIPKDREGYQLKCFLWERDTLTPIADCTQTIHTPVFCVTDLTSENNRLYLRGFACGEDWVLITVFDQAEQNCWYMNEIDVNGNGSFSLDMELSQDAKGTTHIYVSLPTGEQVKLVKDIS